MELANITLNFSETINQEVTPSFCLLVIDNLIDYHNKPIILIINEKNISVEDVDYEYLDFSKKEEYYFVMFVLLRKIVQSNSLLEEIIEDFIKEYKNIISSFEEKTQIKNSARFYLRSILTKKILILLICVLIPILGIIIQKVFVQGNFVKIVIDKPLINEKILLKRKLILNNIEKKLHYQNNIKHVVLAGIGGSGKTTLARQYVSNQKAELKWEINCETYNDIILSFQNLAYTLCDTELEKDRLTIILQTTNITEKEKNLFIFLTKKLKNYPDWILLYDNVEIFKDIQQYFPYNHDVWGNGTVIITTRDSTISNSTYILNENIIQIDELELEEKLELFNKIIRNTNYNIKDQKITLVDFLQKIPSFPLDVSIAANYIKETKISLSEYLEYIDQFQEEFVNFQKKISGTINEYNKTRYEIITLSLKSIIAADPNFTDLLLFISLINAENIPKELLVSYKNDLIVSKFIHELKRFSLINEKSEFNKLSSLKLFIHRSMQLTTLSYLIKELRLTPDSSQLQDIANSLSCYLTNKPLFSIASHVEMFLTHYKLFNEKIKINLSQELGIYYSKTANYQRARVLIEQAFEVNKRYYGLEHIKTAEILMHLAVLHRNTGGYYEAIELIEDKALKIYKKHYGKGHIETAKCITYLGNLYRDMGDYKKAQELLEYSLAIHIKEYGMERIYTARTAGYLGNVYNDIGEYTKAKSLLEQSFNFYSNHYGKDNALAARSFVRLGNLYRNLEEYDKAKKLVEKALIIFEENYGKNHLDTAFALNSLGDILLSSGNYKEGQKFLERALIIFEENYGKNHLDTAFILNSLGKANLLSNNILIAETLLNQALSILQQNKHPSRFISLENLGDLYIQKSTQLANKKDIRKIQDFHKQALHYFDQALEIVQTYLPANSPHVARIKLKLRTYKLQE